MEQITCPLMRFTSRFYEEDIRRGVAEILRRRAAIPKAHDAPLIGTTAEKVAAQFDVDPVTALDTSATIAHNAGTKPLQVSAMEPNGRSDATKHAGHRPSRFCAVSKL